MPDNEQTTDHTEWARHADRNRGQRLRVAIPGSGCPAAADFSRRAGARSPSGQRSGARDRSYVSRVLGKLGLRDRTQAVVTAYESGLVVPRSGVPG